MVLFVLERKTCGGRCQGSFCIGCLVWMDIIKLLDGIHEFLMTLIS